MYVCAFESASKSESVCMYVWMYIYVCEGARVFSFRLTLTYTWLSVFFYLVTTFSYRLLLSSTQAASHSFKHLLPIFLSYTNSECSSLFLKSQQNSPMGNCAHCRHLQGSALLWGSVVRCHVMLCGVVWCPVMYYVMSYYVKIYWIVTMLSTPANNVSIHSTELNSTPFYLSPCPPPALPRSEQ